MTTRTPVQTAPWVSIEEVQGNAYPRYVVTGVDYLDPDDSGGRINVFILLADEHGAPITNMRVLQMNGGITPLFTRSDAGHLGEVDFNQTADSSFDPGKGEVGAYSVVVNDPKGYPSEKVVGLGLPLRRHVSYTLHFQRVLSGAPVVIPPVVTPPTVGTHWELDPASTHDNPLLHWK